jgi:hypothetical protein
MIDSDDTTRDSQQINIIKAAILQTRFGRNFGRLSFGLPSVLFNILHATKKVAMRGTLTRPFSLGFAAPYNSNLHGNAKAYKDVSFIKNSND